MIQGRNQFDWRDLALCLVFFTRLPLPVFDFRDRTLAGAIWVAPAAGLAVALVAAFVHAMAMWLGLSPATAAALTVASALLVTGCLHEDGLSDVADGFGGGKSREKKLEIMRDSRIGAYGAAALCVSILIRWSALSDLAAPAALCAALVAAHMGSRGLLGAFMHMLPPARGDGLSAGAGSVSRETAAIGLVFGFLPLLLIGFFAAVICAILLAAIFLPFRALCQRQIGGHTGDTLGALQQFAEIAILLVASAFLP
jgi:adenosylcobinamide-GDP ribazoletransferase